MSKQTALSEIEHISKEYVNSWPSVSTEFVHMNILGILIFDEVTEIFIPFSGAIISKLPGNVFTSSTDTTFEESDNPPAVCALT